MHPSLNLLLYVLSGSLSLAPQVHAEWLDCYEAVGDGALATVIETGSALGRLEVAGEPWVFSWTFNRYLYTPAVDCQWDGCWAFVPAISERDPLLDDILLYLPLDGGSFADASRHGRAVSRSGAAPGQEEFADSCYFDGVDSYIEVADFNYGPDFSVSFWFNSPDNSGKFYQYMFSHGAVHQQNSVNYYFVEDDHLDTGGQIKTNHLDYNDIEASQLLFSEPGLSDGTWHFYTVTAGEAGTAVYIDGKLIRTAPELGGDRINPPGNIVIGGRSDLAADRFYEGFLDDIRLYNRALQSSEIELLFNRGR